MTVAHVLLRSAQLWGDRPALIDSARSLTISFSELANAILFIGSTLRRHGLSSGDRVAILGDVTPDYLCADYGIMAAGLVRVPLDPALSADELANQIVDSGARVLLTDDNRADLASLLAERSGQATVDLLPIDISAFDQPPDVLRGEWSFKNASRGDLASLNYTGGTSGEPKAVMLSHGNLRAAVQNIVMARGMGPDDVMVN